MSSPAEERSRALPFLLRIYRDHRWRMALIILLLLAVAGINALLPGLSARIIDEGFVSANTAVIIRTALAILLLSVGMALLHVAIEFLRLKGYNQVQTVLKEKALSKLLRINYAYFNRRSTTEVYQQLDEDILVISGCFSTDILMALTQIFVSLTLIPVLFSISWKLSLIMLLAIPLDLLKTMLFSRLGYRLSKRRMVARTRYSAWLADVVSGNRAIRLYGLSSYFHSLFAVRQKEVSDAQISQGIVQESMVRLEGFAIDLLTFVFYVVGGYLIVGGEISLGSFVAFETYSFSVLSVIGQFLSVFYGYATMKPSVERYTDFLREDDEKEGGKEAETNFRELRLEKVTFAYEAAEPLLHDVSLPISAGEHLALIGNNGCGKTTLINLLLGILTPDSGRILINGTDVSQLSLDSYRRLFAVAPQMPFLFCDSIRNNVSLYREEISDEQIIRALEQAGLDELVREKTLDYIVGQNGSELSAGQRQRLSIARTLLSEAPIVILDEPETNLDRSFAAEFGQRMRQIYRGRTLIIITHRMAYTDSVDGTWILENGSVTRWNGKKAEMRDEGCGH